MWNVRIVIIIAIVSVSRGDRNFQTNYGPTIPKQDFITFPNSDNREYRPDYRGYGTTYHKNEYSDYYDTNKDYYSTSRFPLEQIQRINNFTDVNDLLLNLIEDEDEEPSFGNRFGGDERSNAIQPKAAACMPELQTVNIAPLHGDPSILYIPTCTRIERCGGCCLHSLLSCQPKDVESVNLQLVKTQYVNGRFKNVGKEIVVVERHTKCKCDCKDCTAFQEYRKNECRCTCTNTDEEKKCYKENAIKLWDPDLCSCQCRNVTLCSTGYIFDTFRCRCMPANIRRRETGRDSRQQDITRRRQIFYMLPEEE